MSTVDMTAGTKTGKGASAAYNQGNIRVVKRLVDLTKAATAKGSALAAGDFIKAVRIPTGCAAIHAITKVVEIAKDASGVAIGTLHFGLGTNGDTVKFLGQAIGDAGVATFAAPTNVGSVVTWAMNTSGTDSVNIMIGTYSGTVLAAGLIGVSVTLMDMSDFGQANIDASTNQLGVPQS